ncbi:hypothetical protein [Pseudarthrobacter enclensis]|uniref:hypothetical protein n=1 Tax=Pseudarthrobacter enclensis TaxID=993070 RepID=UPI001E520798|nr:hypothetical protein [Pseudarthrobacter enclensis]
MMELMDRAHRRRRQPGREPLEIAAFTALSVGAAVVLLPAIGLKVIAGKLPLVRNAVGRSPELEQHYLIT